MLSKFLFVIIIYFVHCSYCIDVSDIFNCIEEDGFTCRGDSDEEFSCSYICNGYSDCKDGADEGMLSMNRNPCMDAPCTDSSFKCHYGACIPYDQKCDGEKNCADGSDEWSFYCNKKLSNPNRTACSSEDGSYKYILDNLFCNGKADCNDKSDESYDICRHWICDTEEKTRCAYGACIDRGKICDGKIDCVDASDEKSCTTKALPSPPHGCEIDWDPNYDIINENTNAYMTHGDRVLTNQRIIIKCANNFFFEDKADNKTVVCIRDNWDSPLPKCVKYCDEDILYFSKSTTATCTLNSSPVDCKNILPGTIAQNQCAYSYKRRESIRDESFSMICLPNAKWSRNKMNCEPVCGESQSSTNPNASQAPWHVGVKTYLNGTCGGTIISPKNVITALHCVVDENFIVLSEAQVFVIAGGEFKDGQTEIIQKNVSKIFAANDGVIDVAVLELSEPFILSINARPICLGRRSSRTKKNTAFLHGWPKNDDHTGDIFVRTQLKFERNNCQADRTKGELCVRTLNMNHTLCEGHSGSGVITNYGSKNYLTGIISKKPGRSNECTNQPIVAVGIDQITPWLEETISMSDEPPFYFVPA
ncbi:modular serine protease [Ceratitis capitata]|uniref:Low-density lipoprotein receptor n=2 Tax=Ceratitis capitata TaxID=7213 RepID=W8CBV2_CERCA|nr:modular serine protease [Ceratitis capitata]